MSAIATRFRTAKRISAPAIDRQRWRSITHIPAVLSSPQLVRQAIFMIAQPKPINHTDRCKQMRDKANRRAHTHLPPLKSP